jgi:outer membrane receptor protein involved in Fe transport
VSGFDVTLRQAWQGDANTFSADLNVTYLEKLLTSLTRHTTTFDQIDRYNQPLDWRARAMGTWSRGGFSSTVVVSYSDDYINDSLLEDVPVASWTTVDLNVSYDFGAAPRLAFLAGAKVAVGIDNLFDRDPPHADAPVFQPQVGFDVFNADPIGRFITARLIKRW